MTVSRNRNPQIDATTRERRPGSELAKAHRLRFRLNLLPLSQIAASPVPPESPPSPHQPHIRLKPPVECTSHLTRAPRPAGLLAPILELVEFR